MNQDTVLVIVLATVVISLVLLFGSPTLDYGYDDNPGEERETIHECTSLDERQLSNHLEQDPVGASDPSGPPNELSEVENPVFSDVALESNFIYSSENTEGLEGLTNGSVYVTDYNNNGLPDILAIGCKETFLFENLGGEFEVSDTLPEVSISDTAALFFDHDNDGWDDLLLLPKYDDEEGEPVFLENEGGEFTEKEVGLEVEMEAARGASAADYTGNGCLDVFVAQAQSWEDERPESYASDTADDESGSPNRLFAGDCGSFEEVTEEAGIEGSAWSLATSFVDFTNDGYPDIHVANDFNNDVLYLNNGDGTFERRVMPEFTNRNGMSSEVADVTGNGYLDIFVTNIYYEGDDARELTRNRLGDRIEGNNLLLNQGNGSFVDAAEEYGVRSGGWGWAAVFADFDNDRKLDLYHSNTFSSTLGTNPRGYLFERKNSGFEKKNPASLGFESAEAVSVGKLDYNDNGGVDLVVSNRRGDFRLYENKHEMGNYLKVNIESEGNHTTIGTRVYVEAGGEEQMRVKTTRTGYMSQSSRVLHFGIGDADTVDELRVVFPDGSSVTGQEIEANRTINTSTSGISGA